MITPKPKGLRELLRKGLRMVAPERDVKYLVNSLYERGYRSVNGKNADWFQFIWRCGRDRAWRACLTCPELLTVDRTCRALGFTAAHDLASAIPAVLVALYG